MTSPLIRLPTRSASDRSPACSIWRTQDPYEPQSSIRPSSSSRVPRRIALGARVPLPCARSQQTVLKPAE